MVPSCYAHNGARSGDDEKFAEFIVTAIGQDTPAAVAMHEAVKRSFEKNRSKRESFRQRSTYDPELGVYLVKADADAFKRVIRSITRGLWWHHHRRPLGMDVKIRTSLQAGYDPELKDVFKDLRIHSFGGDGQFVYAFNVLDDDPTISIWWYLFQRKVLAAAITNTDELDKYENETKQEWHHKFSI